MAIITKEQYNDLPDHLRKWVHPAEELIGWKTALKPSHEPIVMARKPMIGSTVDNVQEHGTGALNIDGTRVETDEVITSAKGTKDTFNNYNPEKWANESGKDKDIGWNNDDPWEQHEGGRYPGNVLGEVKGNQKYFYCPKVSREERHSGFDTTDIPTDPSGLYDPGDYYTIKKLDAYEKVPTVPANNHPTVKPVALMKWLVTLVTPPGGKVLDPFMGSGSTGMAVKEFKGEFTGIDLDPNYVQIAKTRIDAWRGADRKPTKPNKLSSELFEKKG